MIGSFLNAVSEHAFEIVSLFISAGALVYAVLALKVARQALQIAADSDVAALRLKGQDEASAAERSFLKLQDGCLKTRAQWEQHLKNNIGLSFRSFGQPDETRHIGKLENAGRALLKQLQDATPIATTRKAAELENYIKRAQETAIQIERLAFDLKAPK